MKNKIVKPARRAKKAFRKRVWGPVKENWRSWFKKYRRNRKLYGGSRLIFHAIWAVPAVLILRLVRPLYPLRIGRLRADRIGHYTTDVCALVARRRLGLEDPNETILVWLERGSCNTYWRRVVDRHLVVTPAARLLEYWNDRLPGGASLYWDHWPTGTRDIHGLFDRCPAPIPFSAEENGSGTAWLRGLGWRDGDPFVCLMVRDAAYLETDPLQTRHDSYKQSYRDSDIADYGPAIEWLLNQGVWVIRMGKVMRTPVPLQHPRLVDYAFRDDRSDFLDIWLFGNCSFCISTGSGLDLFSSTRGIPLLFVNLLPLLNLVSWGDVITVPKTLVWRDSQRPLSIQEHLARPYLRAYEYDEAGIEVRSLTPEEILAATRERWLSLTGQHQSNPEQLFRRQQFWRMVRRADTAKPLHGRIDSRARPADVWLDRLAREAPDSDGPPGALPGGW